MKTKIKEYVLLTMGTLLVAIGVYVFKFPNDFSTGGVTGISIILGEIIPGITPGTLVMIINALLLVLGFLCIGSSFGIRTVYCSALMSVSIYVMESVFPMGHAACCRIGYSVQSAGQHGRNGYHCDDPTEIYEPRYR